MAQPLQRIIQTDIVVNTGDQKHVDFSRAFSAYNRKHMKQVDGKGNAQVYLVKVTQQPDISDSSVMLNTVVRTAPNTYVTKAGVKAWHYARKKMFEDQGISLKSLSPYMRELSFVLQDGTNTNLAAGLYTNTLEKSRLVNYSQVDDSGAVALTTENLSGWV